MNCDSAETASSSRSNGGNTQSSNGGMTHSSRQNSTTSSGFGSSYSLSSAGSNLPSSPLATTSPSTSTSSNSRNMQTASKNPITGASNSQTASKNPITGPPNPQTDSKNPITDPSNPLALYNETETSHKFASTNRNGSTSDSGSSASALLQRTNGTSESNSSNISDMLPQTTEDGGSMLPRATKDEGLLPRTTEDGGALLELSFEYLLRAGELRWVRVVSNQAVLMSLCLQSMVQQLLASSAGTGPCPPPCPAVTELPIQYTNREGTSLLVYTHTTRQPKVRKLLNDNRFNG